MSLQRMIELENQIDDIQEMMSECGGDEQAEQELCIVLNEALVELDTLKQAPKMTDYQRRRALQIKVGNGNGSKFGVRK